MKKEEIETIINQLKTGEMSVTEMRNSLHSAAAIIRTNALFALSRHAKKTTDEKIKDEIINDINNAAAYPENRIELLGKTTVAYVAIGCLIDIDTPKSTLEAKKLIDSFPHIEREHLLRYLQDIKEHPHK